MVIMTLGPAFYYKRCSHLTPITDTYFRVCLFFKSVIAYTPTMPLTMLEKNGNGEKKEIQEWLNIHLRFSHLGGRPLMH